MGKRAKQGTNLPPLQLQQQLEATTGHPLALRRELGKWQEEKPRARAADGVW